MNRVWGSTIILFLIAILVFFADILFGGSINIFALIELPKDIIYNIRLPRACCAALSGAALSLGGMQMQSVFRNPLADPHIMGVSSGAALGAALAAMCPSLIMHNIFPQFGLVSSAFIGAVLSCGLVLFASSRCSSSSTLLIFGVLLSFVINAVIGILQFSSNAENLKLYYNWSAGSFSNSDWKSVIVLCVILVLGYILALKNTKGLDLLLFGDKFASYTGASVRKIKIIAVLSSSLLAAGVTAFCGPVGFVGIAAPHICRKICSSSVHMKITHACILTGSILALTADFISQTGPTPLPAGSIMAIIGIPLVIGILLKGRENV